MAGASRARAGCGCAVGHASRTTCQRTQIVPSGQATAVKLDQLAVEQLRRFVIFNACVSVGVRVR